MKIAIISDIHANIFGLKAVISNLGKVDKILCAGDITGFYPFVNEVIEELRNNNIISVKGNHDQYLLNGKAPDDKKEEIKKSVQLMKKIISEENLNYIESLPEILNLEIDNKKALLVHASPWDHFEERIYPDYQNFERFNEIDADVIILGHTHYPMMKHVNDKVVLNPGSCGQPRDYNMPSYVIWDTENNNFENKRVSFNIDEFKRESMERGTDEKLFEVFERLK